MKTDEIQLMLSLLSKACEQVCVQMPPKRRRYLLNKWADRGLYDYGVSLETGWLTPEGEKIAAELSRDVNGDPSTSA